MPIAAALAADRIRPKLHTAPRDTIARHQHERLRAGLGQILASNQFYQRKLAGLHPRDLRHADALAQLPFTTKHELVASQAEAPPFGSKLTYPLASAQCSRDAPRLITQRRRGMLQ